MYQRQSGAPLAATNVKTAGCVCERRDAVRLGRKTGLQPRANERPAVGCSEKLGGTHGNCLVPFERHDGLFRRELDVQYTTMLWAFGRRRGVYEKRPHEQD